MYMACICSRYNTSSDWLILGHYSRKAYNKLNLERSVLRQRLGFRFSRKDLARGQSFKYWWLCLWSRSLLSQVILPSDVSGKRIKQDQEFELAGTSERDWKKSM